MTIVGLTFDHRCTLCESAVTAEVDTEVGALLLVSLSCGHTDEVPTADVLELLVDCGV